MVCISKWREHFEDMAQGIEAGQEKAFEEFFRFFSPRFRAFFLAGGLPQSDADDLAVSCADDIAMKVWQGKKYDRKKCGGFLPWVFTLMGHERASWWREWFRKRTDQVALAPELSATDPPEDEVLRKAAIEVAIEDAKALVPMIDREIVTLRYSRNGYSFPDIGDLLGMSASSVRVRHWRALRKMRAVLEHDERLRPCLRT